MRNIFDAIEAGDALKVGNFIDASIDLEDTGPGDWTALELAIQLHKNDVAKLLIDADARIHAVPEEQIRPRFFKSEAWAALAVATWSNNVEIVEYLLSKGANIHDLGMEFAIKEAAKKGHAQVIELLITNGFNVNSHYSAERGPLLHALIEDECPLDAVELFLKFGANPNAKGRYGYVALELTPNGYDLPAPVISLLKKYGGTLDTGKIGNLVRHWASTKVLIETVYLFGSRYQGSYHPDSDIDIAIKLIKNLDESEGLATWIHKNEKWRNELSHLLPFEVDLQWYGGPQTGVIHSAITNSSVLLYQKS